MAVEYQIVERFVAAGSSIPVKFRLADPTTGLPGDDIPDVQVLYYRSDGRDRTVVPAKPLGDGQYEATVMLDSVSTYYVFVGSRSRDIGFSDLPFASLIAVSPKALKASKAAQAAGTAAK